MTEGNVRKSQSMRRPRLAGAHVKHKKEYGQLPRATHSSWLRVSKETRISILQPERTNG